MPSGRTGIEWNTSALINADNVSALAENINTIKKNTGALLEASWAIGLEINTEKT
jgi:hypothetical protein